MKIRKFNENLLNEALWYKINVNGNDYYAKLTDSNRFSLAQNKHDIVYDPVTWKNNHHELLNADVLKKFQDDVRTGKPITWTNVGNAVPASNNILTPTSRDDRGFGEQFLNPNIVSLIHSDKHYIPDTTKIFVHHLNKKEYNQFGDNLVAVMYNNKNELEQANIAHKLFHFMGAPLTQTAGVSYDIPYFVMNGGTAQKHVIQINII